MNDPKGILSGRMTDLNEKVRHLEHTMTSIVDFQEMEKDMGSITELVAHDANNYIPAAARLPEGFEHIEGTSKVGRLAGEAIAREYLNAADQCDKAGDDYLAAQTKLATEHRALADAIEAEGRDKAAQFHEQAGHIRKRGQDEFKKVEIAALQSDRLLKQLDGVRDIFDPPL